MSGKPEPWHGSEPVRLVIDTNVLVSGFALPRGGPFEIIERWRAGECRVLSCTRQLDELAEVLSRPKLARYVGPGEISDVLSLFEREAEFVDMQTILPRSRDPDDDVMLATAFIGQAGFLVTGDKDLLVLAGNPELGSLRIVSVTEFLEVLTGT